MHTDASRAERRRTTRLKKRWHHFFDANWHNPWHPTTKSHIANLTPYKYPYHGLDVVSVTLWQPSRLVCDQLSRREAISRTTLQCMSHVGKPQRPPPGRTGLSKEPLTIPDNADGLAVLAVLERMAATAQHETARAKSPTPKKTRRKPAK